VQASEFATIGPVPVALLGLGMYLVVLACNLVVRARPDLAVAATAVAFAVALAGAVYAAYLTWLEVAVIAAICQWCVASAILTVVIALLEGFALWRLIGVPPEGGHETGPAPAASMPVTPQGRGTTGPGRRRHGSRRIST
jgi:uncharacterized membrane protein